MNEHRNETFIVHGSELIVLSVCDAAISQCTDVTFSRMVHSGERKLWPSAVTIKCLNSDSNEPAHSLECVMAQRN